MVLATPNPHTWSADELLTQALLNAEIRDTGLWISQAPTTIVYRSTGQNVATSTATAMNFDSAVVDRDDMITLPGTNLVVRRDGVYAIQGAIDYPSSAGSQHRQARITVNGTIKALHAITGVSTDRMSCTVSTVLPLKAGDVITLVAFQNSGSTITTVEDYGEPRISIRWVGAVDAVNTLPPPSGGPTGGTPTKMVKTYQPVWSRTYDGSGNTYSGDPAELYQGYTSATGQKRALIGFNSTTIMADLAGATNISVQLTFKPRHTYFNAGATFYFGGHNYGSKPSTWTGSNVDERLTSRSSSAAGKVYTITLPSGFGDKLKSGAYKGVALGPVTSSSNTYYGYLYGSSQGGKPYLTVTYYV